MAYLGNNPTTQSFTSGTDYFSGTGSQTAFTLTRTVNSVNDIEVVINNVVQQPSTAYTLSGTTVTFTSAPSSGTNNIYVRYLATNMQSFTVSANSIDKSKLSSDLQAGFQGRNRIINGHMVIDQRNAGAAVTTNPGYIVDRWLYDLDTQNASSGTTSKQRSTTSATGFTNSLLTSITSAGTVTAAHRNRLQQRIEGFNISDLGWGTANAKTVTVSFWVRSSLTGTFGGGLTNYAGRSYPFTYTVNAANTFEQKAITITGDTSGTWATDNAIGLGLIFDIGSGSNYNGTAGAWAAGEFFRTSACNSLVATSGATFYLTGVQLEVGSSATGFEYRQYGQELALCQRYYEKSFDIGVAPADNLSANDRRVAASFTNTSFNQSVSFKVTKRATPTITTYSSNATGGTTHWARYSGSWAQGNTTSVVGYQDSFIIDFNTAAGSTVGYSYITGGNWVASAEL